MTHPIRLTTDTKFLRSLKTRCSETNEEFDRHAADRQPELKAMIDAIGIFNSDTSFDTYDKTVSTDFLQMSPLASEQALRQRALSVLRDAMNKVVDDPVVQIPQAHVAEKTVEITQLDVVEKIVETPEIQTGHGIQDRIQQRTVEQIVDVPVQQVVEEQAEASKVFSQTELNSISEDRSSNPLLFHLLERSLRCLSLSRRNSLSTRTFNTSSTQLKWRCPNSSRRQSKRRSIR